MSNPGIGNRFASVNLNKSYGQVAHPKQSNNGGYGIGRGRGSGGGGGMVVLSRPRSAHKTAPKLSVPPPLNLPSLRKEHEKFDTLGAGSGAGGAAGGGARPSSSGLGWSKPSAAVAVERDDVVGGGGDRPLSSDGVQGSTTSVYMPPSARGVVGAGGAGAVGLPVEKVSVLRGEDFPSLRATLNAPNGQAQKQMDSAQQKHRSNGASEELSSSTSGGLRDGFQPSSQVAMRPRPQMQSSGYSADNNAAGGENRDGGNSRHQEQGRKQDDFFPGPLPLVRLSPRSDWADDERDTSHGLSNRNRDHGYSRTDAYWDRDFDFPLNNFAPHKPAQYQFDRRGQRDNDVGKGLSNEVSNADPFVKNSTVPSSEGRQGHPWRNSVTQDVNNRNNSGPRPVHVNRELNNENKYIPPQFGGTARDEHVSGGFTASDLGNDRRDQGYRHSGRQQWNNSVEPNNSRGTDRNYQQRYASDPNRFRADSFQNNMGARPSFPAGGRRLSVSDHLPNFIRDKRSFSKSEKQYVDDPFLSSSSFDGQDPFSGNILEVVKRKKDLNKTIDFHDPVRESFEAELERVQKIQEQERQRVIEEQERAIEMARREEEERLRAIREQEEHQRRMEEEAREAAWRVEHEKMEVIRRAEELKIAREEERQRMMMEEERRKQAAKQKLLELEEKIARRQAESSKADGSGNSGDMMTGAIKDRDSSRPDDFASWEDGERMVERITNSASSDSSLVRPFDMGPRDGYAFTDRGKPFNAWRRDMFDSGNNSSYFSIDHENGHLSPRREGAIGGRSFPRKDLYSGQGYMGTSGHYPGGVPESHIDDFPHARGHQRWNMSAVGDPYGRNMEFESEFHDTGADKFDVGWGQGQGQSRGRGFSPFPDRLYHNADLDEFYSYGRSRYPARQPRVLPPPALSSIQRNSFRSENDCLGSSSFENASGQFNHAQQGDSVAESYQNAHEENSNVIDVHERRSTEEEQKLNKPTVPGCDSQSSLSVSSPPSSPTQLSHDDFDESRPVSGVAEGQDVSPFENEADVLAGKGNTVTTACSISVGDDEEWTVENIEVSPDQEEYDEDAGYHVEGEVHEGDVENSGLDRDFEGMHLEEKGSSGMTENLVLGFDQGVEVVIPNDDHEKMATDDDSLYVGSQGTAVVKHNESFDGPTDRQKLEAADSVLPVMADSSSPIADGTDKGLQGHVSDTNSASVQPSSSSIHDQQSVSSDPNTDASLSNQAAPEVGGVTQGAAELPKLQFGLFSGPSLIPSPVPAIQIGSIQMPLQLHPHIGPPLPHMHTSQAPLFQFGQLRYPASMSQGILSLAPQPMSYVQPNVPHNFASSQVPKGSQTVQNSSPPCLAKSDGSSYTVNNHPSQPSNQSRMCQETEIKKANLLSVPSAGSNVNSLENQAENSASVNANRPELGQQTDIARNSKPFLNNRISGSRSQGRDSSLRSASNLRNSGGPAAHQFPANRGRRFGYSSRNSDGRLTSPANDTVRSDANGYQRRPRRVTQRYEFRVRQTADGNQTGLEAQSKFEAKDSGTQLRSGLDKPKLGSDLSSGKTIVQEADSMVEENKTAVKLAVTDDRDPSLHQEGSLKRNLTSEDDVDAPLQTGVVRVYRQPGIEVPSDEDDFIEVRSKRQMLNDRREQREKEMKANKSSNMKKPQRKHRPAPEGTSSGTHNRSSALPNTQAAKNVRAAVKSKGGFLNNESSGGFSHVVSKPLGPVGTVLVGSDNQTNAKVQSVKPVQRGFYTAAKQIVHADGSDLTSDGQEKVDTAQSTLGSWGSSCMNQSVMTLTQTQLEEAMKPGSSDTNIVFVKDRSTSVSEPPLMPSSSASKSTSFSSAASPISSLLAGENIQFGAVTSSSIISSLDVRTTQSMSATDNNYNSLFDKEKHVNESCQPLEDCVADAEAAASAIAVAAIGNDEVVENVVGNAAVPGISAGMTKDQNTISHSKTEETLSVSLPADLSVETPPISIWPPLPSPHSSSSQMLSPFPGGPNPHFPFYDMNPMMGGPLFAFGPTDDSSGPVPQPPKSSAPSSGPLGTWPQCHTGVDSLYGPAGFTAPFMSAPGSIPGVQGPPHMVVYNHFASVGQFGQVGLSYMGTTYVPSGKQPDWKHNPTSAAMSGNEGELNNVNMVPVLRNAPNVPAQSPHLAPGSPLFSMASPLGMYEVPPFQSSPDITVHPRWSHVQASSDPTIPQSGPSQSRAEVTVPSQFSHGSSLPPSNTNGFSKPQSSSIVDSRSSAPFASVPSVPDNSTLTSGNKGHFEDSVSNDATTGGSVSKRNSQPPISASHKTQPAHQRNTSGYVNYQKGGGPRNGSGADYSNRKMGFRGQRSFAPVNKVKQIYVAKQSTSGSSSTDV